MIVCISLNHRYFPDIHLLNVSLRTILCYNLDEISVLFYCPRDIIESILDNEILDENAPDTWIFLLTRMLECRFTNFSDVSCIPTCSTTNKKYLCLVRFVSNELNWNMVGFKLHIDLKIVPTPSKEVSIGDDKRCTIAKQVGEHFMLPMKNLVLISFGNNLMFDIIYHVFFRDSIYVLNE